MSMDLPATPALAKFEMDKNDPKVEALKSFILLNLCQLGQVTLWDIRHVGDESRLFYVEFLDERRVRHRVEGTLRRQETREHTRRFEGDDGSHWSVENWGYAW